jgi:uncharacterized protein YjiS (DUF1127 family)
MQINRLIHLPGDAVAARPAGGLAVQLLGRVVAALRRWHAEQRTLAEIDQLDDATLRDIGVDRWQLRAMLADERERVAGRRGLWQGQP